MLRISAPSTAPVGITSIGPPLTSPATLRSTLKAIGTLQMHAPIRNCYHRAMGEGRLRHNDVNAGLYFESISSRLAQTCVELVQRGGARTQRLLVERVERRIHRVEMVVQIFRLGIDV